jgi:hypothetical protein
MACASDCPANAQCSGHVPVCSNTYTFSSIVVGGVIRADDITDLEDAINTERVDNGRRFASTVCSVNAFGWHSFSAKVAGTRILANDINLITTINNYFKNVSGYGSTSTLWVLVQDQSVISLDPSSPYYLVPNNPGQGIILASDITYLQQKVNESRNCCICDSACSCNINCGCNGECSDDLYYYYYP